MHRPTYFSQGDASVSIQNISRAVDARAEVQTAARLCELKVPRCLTGSRNPAPVAGLLDTATENLAQPFQPAVLMSGSIGDAFTLPF